MDISITISALRGLGYDEGEILRVIEAISEQKKICSREKAADRQRSFRERNASNAVTQKSVTEDSNAVTQKSVTEPRVYKDNHASADGNPCSTSLRSVEINTPSLRSGGGAKRAHRLPEDWVLPDRFRQAALERGLSESEIDRQAARMLNWSLSAKAGAKLDWFRTWLNWIDDAPRQTSPPKAVDRGGVGALWMKLNGLDDGKSREIENSVEPVCRLSFDDGGGRDANFNDDCVLPFDSGLLLKRNAVGGL